MKLKNKFSKYNAIVLFIFFTIISYILHYPMKNILNLDEGTYLAISMLFSQGKMIYRDIFTSKPPLFHIINSSL